MKGKQRMMVNTFRPWMLLIVMLPFFLVSFAPETGAAENEKAVTTTSGLQLIDLTTGTGREAHVGETAVVHYTGWLTNGTKFDSSKDRNKPFAFQLGAGHVIKGWDEGVVGMKIGGTRKLIIPPQLGYGAHGAGNVIPPNATLIFEINLLDLR